MPSIILTGERTTGRHRVVVHGRAVYVSTASFALLATLARARLQTETGYLASDPLGEGLVNPVSIHRLRRAIGDDVIETGVIREYRLRPSASEISIDRSLGELPLRLLPFGLVDALLQFSGIELKSTSN